MKKLLSVLPLVFLTLFFVSCASTNSLDKIDSKKLFSKTWSYEKEEFLPAIQAKLVLKLAYKFTEDSVLLTSLCRYLDKNGEDVKSFFVTVSGPVEFNSDFSEFEVKKRISKMESEKVTSVKNKKTEEFSYYTCFAEMNTGRTSIGYNKKDKLLVLTPMSESVELKEQ